MTHEMDAAGIEERETFLSLAQPHGKTRLQRPSEVRLVGEGEGLRVVWRNDGSQLVRREVSPAGVLKSFRRLAHLSEDDVAAGQIVKQFVERWGPLANWPSEWEGDDQEDVWQTEPVGLYLLRARQFQAMIAIAAGLKIAWFERDKPPRRGHAITRREDWEAATCGQEDVAYWAWADGTRGQPDVRKQIQEFNALVGDYLIRPSQWSPELHWGEDGTPRLTIYADAVEGRNRWMQQRQKEQTEHLFKMQAIDPDVTVKDALSSYRQNYGPHRFCPSRLFSLLALQTVAAISRPPDGQIPCDRCSLSFEPKHRFREKPNFCPDCQHLNDNKRSNKSYHKRKDEKKAG